MASCVDVQAAGEVPFSFCVWFAPATHLPTLSIFPPPPLPTWLSLYFLLTHTSTTADCSTALAMASSVEPDILSMSIHVV